MPLRIRFPPAEDLEVIGWNQTFAIVLRKNLLLSKFYCLCKNLLLTKIFEFFVVENGWLSSPCPAALLARSHPRTWWRDMSRDWLLQDSTWWRDMSHMVDMSRTMRDWAVTRFNQKQKRERNQQLKQQQQHLAITWLQANSLSNKNIINNNKNENNNNGNNNN